MIDKLRERLEALEKALRDISRLTVWDNAVSKVAVVIAKAALAETSEPVEAPFHDLTGIPEYVHDRSQQAESYGGIARDRDPEEAPSEQEVGWLIERRKPTPEWLFVPEWAGFDWTNDSLKALRFSRREDAEQILKMMESEDAIATEHGWGL